ncbi:MAG TPA: DUF2267 domain-containing protein [candidate division Zixibacteria bacterium]|nr:DUF2267 domain-containing protein [candidate division Zixibacteria bacterium]
MKYDEFIREVQSRARLSSLEEAVRATRATLSTLSERITEGEANNLAAQLPDEVVYLMGDSDHGQRFGLDEFFNKVSEKEGSRMQDAVYHARVVIEVIGDAVTGGELEDVKAQLPDEYNKLFEAGSKGEMPSD